MSARIAVIHPEGNFPNNPHLGGLIETLVERGHAVDVLCRPHVSQAQVRESANPRLLAMPVAPGSDDPPRSVLFGPGTGLSTVARSGLPRYDLVIGVDLGVIEAAWVARARGAPHGLISYELHFADESPPGFKDEEIDACRDLAFAVCQDPLRAGLLARENALDPSAPLFTMPVAGRGARPGERSFALHQALGLPRRIKLALAMGSADAAWTGARELLRDVSRWPEDWALVLHHRFDQAGVARLRERLDKAARGKVFVSPFASLPGHELGRLLHACDLGLVFYTPTHDAPLLGKNLEHIGMASGKFCTYLQHGLPVLVSDQGEMGGHVERQGLGWRVERIDQTHSLLRTLTRADMEARRPACLDFFSRALDLNALAGPFLEAVDAALAARKGGTLAGSGAAAESTEHFSRDVSDGAFPPPGHEPGVWSPESGDLDPAALLARARLALAQNLADKAAEPLALAAHLAGADLEAIHLLAVELGRRERPDLAGPVFRAVGESPQAGDALAAWAHFKRGEAAEQAGDRLAARALYEKALARDPSHAKAALALAPVSEPLVVRLRGWEPEQAGENVPAIDMPAINIPMDPLDQGLWDYYFARRSLDHAVLGLPAGTDAADLERLARLLCRHMAQDGKAQVRLAGEGPGSGASRETTRAIFTKAGLAVEGLAPLAGGALALSLRAPGLDLSAGLAKERCGLGALDASRAATKRSFTVHTTAQSPLGAIHPTERHNYVAFFLTLRCNLRCPWCINLHDGASRAAMGKRAMDADAWIQAANRLELRPDLPLTLQGGEPTLHPGFYRLVNEAKPEIKCDLLTNLSFDVEEFIANVPRERFLREAPYAPIRVSYHPGQNDIEELLAKYFRLVEAGFRVGLYGILHPDPEARAHIESTMEHCLGLGVDFRTKEYLGEWNGALHGHYLYPGAVMGGARRSCRCRTGELLVDPAGGVFKCHSDLFAGRDPYAHILDADLNEASIDEFRDCAHYGECNPCDVKVKTNRFQQFGHTSVEIVDLKD